MAAATADRITQSGVRRSHDRRDVDFLDEERLRGFLEAGAAERAEAAA